MGCAPSLLEDEDGGGEADDKRREDENNQRSPEMLKAMMDPNSPYHTVAAYVQLEKEIINEENVSPAPAFGQAVAKQQQAKNMLKTLSEKRDNKEFISNENSIEELFQDLKINRNAHIAAEHEEFIANINRKEMSQFEMSVLTERLENGDDEVKKAAERVNHLQDLYQHQDSLLARVFGESYGNEKEKKLEQELDTMRHYRDTLSSGAAQWEDCLKNVNLASDLLDRAVKLWESLDNQPIRKAIQMAAETRNNIHEAVLLVRLSQEILRGVQFPYCTSRELTAIIQALEYIFTDVHIKERYYHALHVYANFQQRAVALAQWVNKVLSSSLKKDLYEIDEKVSEYSRKLREERVQLLCDKLKIPNNYNQFGLNPGVKNIRPALAQPRYEREEYFDQPGPPRFSKLQQPMRPETRYTQHNLLQGQYYDDAIRNDEISINLGPTLGLNHGGRPNDGKIFRDPNIQREFEKKLAARQNAMWPSRRIEELRMMTLDHLQH